MNIYDLQNVSLAESEKVFCDAVVLRFPPFSLIAHEAVGLIKSTN